MESKNKFLKFYLLIISIVATLGTVISFGFLAYTFLDHQIISDEEYVTNNRKYQQCLQATITYDNISRENITQEKTPEEIEQCQADTLITVSQDRQYGYKNDLIAEISWFVVFLLLLVTHFPFFLKYNREKKK